MEIGTILNSDLVILELEAKTKEAVIQEMVSKLDKAKIITDAAKFEAVIWEREKQGTTGIGDGIAIPHGKSELVTKPTVLFARSTAGVEFDSLDGKKAHLFFMIATPADSNDAHLKILSNLSIQLMKANVRQELLVATDGKTVVSIFEDAIEEKKAVQNTNSNRPFVVAVTGCSTGIAHTYMAAEKLKEVAESKNVDIKVETNGSTGVENQLTAQDIARSVGVIIAADINVEMERFESKKLVSVPVADGIHKAGALIDTVVTGEAKEYHASEHTEGTTGSVGQQLYKHLLSGVSHMLPFVVGGGIAIALAFLVDQLLGVPQTELANLGSYNEWAGYLMTIGGTAFGFMLPVLAGYIAYSIADRPGLVVGFVAGGIAATGGAGFLGALLGGFLAGYIIQFLKKALKGLPKSLDGIKTILFFPVLGVLIVGGLMLLINIPMSILNTSMNAFLESLSGANAILLGLILGTMMAIDLGGPINKSAYIFATGTLAATVATGGSSVMAAVMAAGMVPPLAIFIAALLFKNKFTKTEQETGLTNLVLGLSFITEGAIPFAASDPIRMLPSFVIGSALTGALVLFLDIKVMAPHGGIFVLFLVSKPIIYLIVIAVGSFVSAACIGFLKKK